MRKSLLIVCVLGLLLCEELSANGQTRFVDDFENGLRGWVLNRQVGAFVMDSGDPNYKNVLVLRPYGDVYALVKGSEAWGGLRIEGEVLFPAKVHNYLGIVYNFRRQGNRTDFGVIYIKGNDSYLRVNPHRDFNVGRTLYEEYRTPLEGKAAIYTGEWQKVKAEVIGSTCHFYVGDMETPQLTFSHLELSSGSIGFKPRSVGGDVWVDNIEVTAIRKFSYTGPPRPVINYEPKELVNDWKVSGPFPQTHDQLARAPAAFERRWRPYATDARGAVISGKVIDYLGPRTVAYFRTQVRAGEDKKAVLHLSTVDDLAIWVNGRLRGFIDREEAAWFDFWRNRDHQGQRISIDLKRGTNEIVIRVRGGIYATGGFFARIE